MELPCWENFWASFWGVTTNEHKRSKSSWTWVKSVHQYMKHVIAEVKPRRCWSHDLNFDPYFWVSTRGNSHYLSGCERESYTLNMGDTLRLWEGHDCGLAKMKPQSSSFEKGQSVEFPSQIPWKISPFVSRMRVSYGVQKLVACPMNSLHIFISIFL